jgi:protein-tyrosine kinase
MERIQAAIAKARAKRAEGPAPDKTQGGRGAGSGISAGAAAVTAAWEALVAFGPRDAHLEDNRIVAHRPGPLAASFDVMRTKILLQARANSWRRLAITSPTADCGKTTIAANLAFCLARQSELRVLLVDLDLRRPAILQTFGITRDLDIARVLAGDGEPDAQMLRIGANLAVTANARPVEHSAELLQGVQAAEVLDRIEARFAPDLVIFDMPPMLVADDTLGFIDQTDCALLVAAAEQTTLEEIAKCEADLASRTNSLGVVLNRCRYRDKAASYGYDY